MNLAIKLPPATRSTDPNSSQEAERRITESGARMSQAESILALVRSRPGKTCVELTEWTDLDRYQVQRRLSDLCAAGRVRKGKRRKCTLKLTSAVTWWPA